MSTISVNDVQQDFAAVLARVAAGESLTVVDHDKAVAEIKPVSPPTPAKRQFGISKGLYVVPDDFMHACAEEIEKEFEGDPNGL